MAKDIRTLSAQARLAFGLGCIALGCFPIAASLGLMESAESGRAAPGWVIASAGLVFILCGFMILMAHHSRFNNLLAGALLLLFSILGVWTSLFSPGESISGGLPFLSRETNILVGRWVFGLGAAVSLALSIWAFRRSSTRSKHKTR